MSEMQQLKDMGFGQSEAELAMQQANGQAAFHEREMKSTKCFIKCHKMIL